MVSVKQPRGEYPPSSTRSCALFLLGFAIGERWTWLLIDKELLLAHIHCRSSPEEIMSRWYGPNSLHRHRVCKKRTGRAEWMYKKTDEPQSHALLMFHQVEEPAHVQGVRCSLAAWECGQPARTDVSTRRLVIEIFSVAFRVLFLVDFNVLNFVGLGHSKHGLWIP